MASTNIVSRLGWTVGSFGVSQALRFGTSVVLSRLLAPELFGIMLIVNSARTGVDLLSDVGIGQNIVSAKNGSTADFHATAWTIQIVRGVLLAILFALASVPLARFFAVDDLLLVMPAMATVLLIAGFYSTARFQLQREQRLRRLATFEMLNAVASSAIFIAFAVATPSVWALVLGTLASAAVTVLMSFWLIPRFKLRLAIDPAIAVQILHFGKWVFGASILYFFSMHLDRFFMAKSVALATLGVYGVARSLSEICSVVATRIGNMIIFPAVSEAFSREADVRTTAKVQRRLLMILATLGTSALLSVSDAVIEIIYDDRYHDAAAMLPWLLVGTWFAMLATFGEAVLLGVGRPAAGAAGNAVKVLGMVIGLPLALSFGGITLALVFLAGAELARYLAIWAVQRRVNLSFGRQDLMFTIAMFALAALWRSALWAMGWVDPIELPGWLPW